MLERAFVKVKTKAIKKKDRRSCFHGGLLTLLNHISLRTNKIEIDFSFNYALDKLKTKKKKKADLKLLNYASILFPRLWHEAIKNVVL